MKRFQFKLNPLLSYRKYLERLAQQETAKANLDVKTCEKAIAGLKQSRARQADMIADNLQQGMTASEFRRQYDYIDAVEAQINTEKKKKVRLKYVLNEKVKILKKKSVDKKAMELYRDRKKTEYNIKLRQTEQKELDEISSLKTARTLSDETR